eukprot:10436409-Heterocapsa_arctica.AAC.1
MVAGGLARQVPRPHREIAPGAVWAPRVGGALGQAPRQGAHRPRMATCGVASRVLDPQSHGSNHD